MRLFPEQSLSALAIFVAATLAGPVLAQPETRPETPDEPGPPGAVEAEPAAPEIDPFADELLQKMSDTLAGAKQFSVRATMVEAIDDAVTGKRTHYWTQRTVALSRPDRLHVEEGDRFARHALWFDAGRLTALDVAENRSAVADVPKTIDGMIDELFQEHGLVMPAGDLLYSNPYEVLIANVEVGYDLGPAVVNGRIARHLAFRQAGLDWQIWIAQGSEGALPIKIVITYKDEPGQPQFMATISDWNLSPGLGDDDFTAKLPPDTERVTIDELTGANPTGTEGAGARATDGILPYAALLLLANPEPRAAAFRPPGRGGGGRRGGGGHRASRSSSHRGAARPNGRGSVRHHSRSSSRSRGASGRRSSGSGRSSGRSAPRSTGARSAAAQRANAARAGGGGRAPGGRTHRASEPRRRGGSGPRPRSYVHRTVGAGSIRGRDNVGRSFADRQHSRPGAGPGVADRRALRDIGRDPGRGPGHIGDRPVNLPAHRPGYPGYGPGDRWDRRVRRRALAAAARRYYWGGGYYYYDDGYWWEPYYTDDVVEYVQTYPDEGLLLDELPEGAEEVEIDGETYYVINGYYYQQVGQNSYKIVDEPDDGTPDPITFARQGLDFIAQQPAFTMIVIDTMDHVQDDGQKIQSETRRTFTLRRANALAATAKGDDDDRSVWYDGKSFTIVDRLEGCFAETAAPDTIDGLIDFAISELSVNLPMVDLLTSDPFAMLQGAMQDAEYLGLMDVDGVPCHHLSFSAGGTDWQLWVDSGEQPLPKMMAITYTDIEESPTYTGRIENWELAPKLAGDAFTAVIPDGLEEIPLVSPQAEVSRIEKELDDLRDKNQRIEDYMASQRTIELFGQIADKPDAAARIATEKAKQEKLGPVTQKEIDAYEAKKDELEKDLAKARAGVR